MPTPTNDGIILATAVDKINTFVENADNWNKKLDELSKDSQFHAQLVKDVAAFIKKIDNPEKAVENQKNTMGQQAARLKMKDDLVTKVKDIQTKLNKVEQDLKEKTRLSLLRTGSLS